MGIPFSNRNADPIISVIIPNFNKRETLRKGLKSLSNQDSSCPSFEIVVIDDGSNDNTGEMVETLTSESPVPVVDEWQPNRGVSAARNRLSPGKPSN